jgi:general secretion pathway protein G
MSNYRRRPERTRNRGGFTMIEILMVIIIISILLALLLPAINSAFRTARKSAVSAEINQLAQALANFKSKYGEYPPSRFLAIESGAYTVQFANNSQLSNTGTLPDPTQTDPTSPGINDITFGQLAQRSAAALRKFFPRVSTTGAPAGTWYDFNGNGGAGPDAPYVLHGHECLVFFLGGVPTVDNLGNFGLTGFDKNPTNPFTNSIVGNQMYGNNRQPPLYEFTGSRLFLDPLTQKPGGLPGMPAYYDSLNNTPPSTASTTLNFFAYFSAYGNAGYDPNDVNFSETDAAASGPIGLNFTVPYPTFLTANSTSNVSKSPAPNPYTSTLSVAPPVVTFQSPQSFQIISSGLDGLYGIGGQFSPSSTSSTAEALPVDMVNWLNTADLNVRKREVDNLTSFKTGSLE